MATLNINLDKLITEKLEAKIEEIVGNAVNSALQNINFTWGPEKEICKECDQAFIGNDTEDWPEKKLIEDEKADPRDEIVQGWVEKTNNYMAIINRMKQAMTEEQLEFVSTPPRVVSAKEYAFNKFMTNLSWDQLREMFNSNEYIQVDINFDEFQKSQFEVYGTTPYDIYILLLTDIIKEKVAKLCRLKIDYEKISDLDTFIIDEFYKDYDDRALKLTQQIIENHQIDLFDEIFGDKWYKDEENKYKTFLREKYADQINKSSITNKEINDCIYGTTADKINIGKL